MTEARNTDTGVYGNQKQQKTHQSEDTIKIAKEHCNADVVTILGMYFYYTAYGQVTS